MKNERRFICITKKSRKWYKTHVVPTGANRKLYVIWISPLLVFYLFWKVITANAILDEHSVINYGIYCNKSDTICELLLYGIVVKCDICCGSFIHQCLSHLCTVKIAKMSHFLIYTLACSSPSTYPCHIKHWCLWLDMIQQTIVRTCHSYVWPVECWHFWCPWLNFRVILPVTKMSNAVTRTVFTVEDGNSSFA